LSENTARSEDARASGRAAPLGFALVALTAIVAFALGLQGGMIGDDQTLLERRIAASSFGDLLAYFGQNYWGELHAGGLYRPFTLFILGLQKLAFGDELAAYRSVSLILHAAVSLLALRLLTLLVSPRASLLGALVFAAHPIHAEAVVTIYGQGDLWAALFFMLALVRAVRLLETGWSLGAGLTVAALYFLSLLAKEAGVLLPLVVLMFVPLVGRAHGRPAAKRLSLLLGATFVAFLALRIAVLGALVVPLGEASIGTDAPLSGRLQLVVVTLGSYFKLTFFPYWQTVYYGHLRESVVGTPWVEALWLALVPLGLVVLRRRFDISLVWLLVGWFALTIGPVANLIPIGTIVAERCLYVPSFALSLLVAALAQRKPESRAIVLATSALVLAGVALSARVCHVWRTSESHWEAVTRDHPKSPKAFAAVGTIRLNELSEERRVRLDDPRLVEIEAYFDRALELNPQSVEALKGKARLAQRRRRPNEALSLLRRAFELRPDPDIARRIEALLQRRNSQ